MVLVWSRRSILAPSLLSLVTAGAAGPSYRYVTVDSGGRLHIALERGSIVKAPLLKGQVGFRAPEISPDHRTVGWLAEYPYPSPPEGARMAPIAGALVLYRSGRIFRSFSAAPTFWDWQFQDGGKHVAYSMGPLHGGATECVLRFVDSGAVVATWLVKGGKVSPHWARDLRV